MTDFSLAANRRHAPMSILLSAVGKLTTKLGRACAILVLLSSLGLASVAGASEPGPSFERQLLVPATPSVATTPHVKSLFAKELAVLTDQGISPTGAMQAITVQGDIARSGILAKLEAVTGSAFGGAWFEPAAAQLHVGVTSSNSRETAERAIARTGLTPEVVVTPVPTAMPELLTAQRRWDHKLAAMFAREEVRTGIEPQRNAVSVVLGSSVPPVLRAALERAASASKVDISISVRPGQFSVTPNAKTECEKFAKNTAVCNRSITAGVTISGAGICTAGPLAINNKKERVVLTAGHCIGAVGENWSAKEIAGAEKVIGPVEAFANGGVAENEKKGDYADIRIEAGWQTGKPAIPAFAVTTEWLKMNEGGEKTSYPVRGERAPVVKNTNCHEGQTSGESCGEIKMLNVTFIAKKKWKEGQVEDTGANLISESGDSGGPWLFIEPNREALMEGTHSGDVSECVELEKELTGEPFFKTRTECINAAFKEEPTNKGKWERHEYLCNSVGKVEKGPKFFKTTENCEEGELAGEGEIERSPNLHVVYQPLKQPVAGAAEGSLEALKLELLTTANEVLPAAAIKVLPGETFPVTFKLTSGETKIETAGAKKAAITCTADTGTGEFENGGSGTETISYTGCKSSGAGCRSENAKGEKAAVETILATGAKLSVVNLKNAKKELEGGVVTTLPEAVKVVCGVIKVELRGSVLGLITPINKEVLTTETAKLELKQKEGKQEAGECQEPKETCEKLAKEPFEAKLAEKFEGAGVQSTETISLAKMVEVAA